MTRTRHFTVLLLKQGVRQYADVLKDPGSLRRFPLKRRLPFRGALFVQAPRQRQPRWTEFAQEGVDAAIGRLQSASVSAVLFVEVDQRIFAFTFGYGRHLIQPGAHETDFGLKVTLNSVDPDRLRSVDARTFEELTVHTQRQTSRGSPVEAFGLDVRRDVVRAVTGKPRDEAFGSRVTGSDALAINTRLEFRDLASKCDQMLLAYGSDSYKENFGWVDQLKDVRDPERVQTLDELLLEIVREEQTERFYLAPPELVEWAPFEGFRYQSEARDERHDDLDASEWLGTLGEAETLSIETLKSSRVEAYYAGEDIPRQRWSIYECIVFETDYGGLRYVLTGGKWFGVSTTFADTVRENTRQLVDVSDLPRARDGEHEDEYNTRAATDRGDLLLLDRQLISYGGGRSRIELCDLLSNGGHFIHVKHRRSSQTLSHLFSQGTVAAEIFLGDPEFRAAAKALVRRLGGGAGLISTARPNPADYKVVYAIISASDGWPDSLPFFSQLNLMQATQRLQLLGYPVSLKLVELE